MASGGMSGPGREWVDDPGPLDCVRGGWCSDSRASRVLMRAHAGGIHRDTPVDFAALREPRPGLLQKTLPSTVGRRPLPVALVDGLPGAVPLREIPPVHIGPYPVQDPVDHRPMVAPTPAPTITHRQQRPQPFPLGIRQLTTPTCTRTHNGDPMSSRSHDRPDGSLIVEYESCGPRDTARRSA